MASFRDIPDWKNEAFGVIAFLRFPLIALIVLFHAFNVSVTTPPGVLDYHQPVTDLVYWHILHDAIATVAVPLFFVISGFLYFRSGDFSWAAWKSKTRKRLFRLALPLLSWSCLAFLLMALFHVLHLPNATAKMYFDSSHSPLWWLDAFIGFRDPMGPRLAHASWFIRDLFVVGLLSPVWYPLLKRRLTAALLLVGLFVVYLFWFAPLPFLGSRPMFSSTWAPGTPLPSAISWPMPAGSPSHASSSGSSPPYCCFGNRTCRPLPPSATAAPVF